MTPNLITQWGVALIIGALAAIAVLIVHGMATDRRHLVPSCPCCTLGGRDYDCTCREDCGVTCCQARDPEPRPQCPWCDTRECLDSTLCNCAEPCGSWLCVDKKASRG